MGFNNPHPQPLSLIKGEGSEMDYRAELVLLFAATAAACAVPGVFLVLRRTALVAEDRKSVV